MSIESVVSTINSVVWSPVLIYFLLSVGLFYSVVTRFVQVRQFKEMIRLLFKPAPPSTGISTFQALTVALSGRVGTGNIAGVAAAIGFGGPGAVFWMWVVAFLGAATAYTEGTLAQLYKEKSDGQYRGGPAYYIEKAMKQSWFAWVFAFSAIVAYGLLLPGIQANSIGESFAVVFGSGNMYDTPFGELSLTKILVAIGLVIMLSFIIFGGIKRIATFSQFMVPFMAVAYILMAMVIIGMNIGKLDDVFVLIVSDAFSPMAAFGAAIGWGVKRGVYSNEAGQGGIGPHAAAAAEVEHPAQQGLVQAFSVYVDTLFVCSATAFMILITGAYNVHGGDAGFIVQNIAASVEAYGPAFTQLALDSAIPGFGKIFVAIALLFFAFTTILAYYFVAETNIVYLKRTLKMGPAITILKFFVMASVAYGAIKSAKLAWDLGDIGVGMMAWLNIVGMLIIFFVSRPAFKALKDYERQQKNNHEHYTFDPKSLDIENAQFWEDRLKENKDSK